MTFDYDKYYDELLKNALKYGMSRNDFWYGSNYKDYFLYEEAYYEKMHEQTHIQGYYNYIALNVVLSNMFMDKNKGNKPLVYPEKNIYASAKEKRVVGDITSVKTTKENKQKVFMKRLANCY